MSAIKIEPVLKDNLPALGIDIGGTKIAAALISNCKIVSQRKEVPTRPGRENVINTICDFVKDFSNESPIAGIGVSTCGMVNDHGEIVGSADNIPGWLHTKVKALVQERTNLPVDVENDANASAYGEYRAQNLSNQSCVAVITLGTGIGGGIIINGQVHRGTHFGAGEVGHFRISVENRRRCVCGLWDCWEAYGAGKGLVATAQDFLQQPEGERSNLWKHKDALTTRLIIEAVEQNDHLAQQVMHKWHQYLSHGIGIVAEVLDPECFILTGGLSKFVDYQLLTKLVDETTIIGISGNSIAIHPSILGENPGLIGAGQLVLDKLAALARVGVS